MTSINSIFLIFTNIEENHFPLSNPCINWSSFMDYFILMSFQSYFCVKAILMTLIVYEAHYKVCINGTYYCMRGPLYLIKLFLAGWWVYWVWYVCIIMEPYKNYLCHWVKSLLLLHRLFRFVRKCVENNLKIKTFLHFCLTGSWDLRKPFW